MTDIRCEDEKGGYHRHHKFRPNRKSGHSRRGHHSGPPSDSDCSSGETTEQPIRGRRWQPAARLAQSSLTTSSQSASSSSKSSSRSPSVTSLSTSLTGQITGCSDRDSYFRSLPKARRHALVRRGAFNWAPVLPLSVPLVGEKKEAVPEPKQPSPVELAARIRAAYHRAAVETAAAVRPILLRREAAIEVANAALSAALNAIRKAKMSEKEGGSGLDLLVDPTAVQKIAQMGISEAKNQLNSVLHGMTFTAADARIISGEVGDDAWASLQDEVVAARSAVMNPLSILASRALTILCQLWPWKRHEIGGDLFRVADAVTDHHPVIPTLPDFHPTPGRAVCQRLSILVHTHLWPTIAMLCILVFAVNRLLLDLALVLWYLAAPLRAVVFILQTLGTITLLCVPGWFWIDCSLILAVGAMWRKSSAMRGVISSLYGSFTEWVLRLGWPDIVELNWQLFFWPILRLWEEVCQVVSSASQICL